MSLRRASLVLLVIGLVLLPGPKYAIGLDRMDGPDRHRVSNGYVAEPIDVSNDSVLAEEYAQRVSFRTSNMQLPYVAEEYRAPNRTRDVLERAIREGTATTSDEAVAADLRRLERKHTFLTADSQTYYAYTVESTADATTIETTRANGSVIAAAVREELVVSYDDLPEDERATFRKIRDATQDDDRYDYRPWSDEPVPEEPIVEREGTHYAVEVTSQTDDFNVPDGLFLGFAASAVGFVCVLLSVGVGLYAYRNG